MPMAADGGPWPARLPRGEELPHDIGLERALIGAVVVDRSGRAWQASRHLPPEAFALNAHAALWRALPRCVVGDAVDPRLAMSAARDLATTLPDAPGALIEATDAAGPASSAGDYAARIDDLHRRRRLICIGADARNPDKPVADLLAEAAALHAAPATGNRFDGEDVAALLAEPIPPREWLLDRHLCRGFVTVVAAAGGTGKTSLLIAWALSLATGRDLIGMRPHHRARVLLVTLEDDRAELLRRIKAACLHYEIDRADVAGWLRVKALAGQSVTLATVTPAGDMAETPATGEIIEAMRRHAADVLIADPWVKLSGAPENDNGATDFVVKLLSRIAGEANAAVAVAHHHRKGAATPGDTDSARGAKSLIDAARIGLTLNRMSEAEANTFEVAEKERWRLARLDDGKMNLAPAGSTTWFRLASVHLDNGTAGYPDGDNVQAIEAWTPPDAFQDMSTHTAREILLAIDAAESLPDGERYTDAKRAKGAERWAGVVIMDRAGKSGAEAKRILAAWINAGVLRVEPYETPDRKKRRGLIADHAKLPGAING
jgi:RecA-family ATPase